MIASEAPPNADSPSESRHPPRQLRIEPHDPIFSDRKIRRMQRLRFQEREHRPVYLRPLRLHHVEHKRRSAVPIIVHDSKHRVIALRNEPDLHLALKDRIGVVQDGVDGMRCVPASARVHPSVTRRDSSPFIGNGMACGRPPQQRGRVPSAKICYRALSFQ